MIVIFSINISTWALWVCTYSFILQMLYKCPCRPGETKSYAARHTKYLKRFYSFDTNKRLILDSAPNNCAWNVYYSILFHCLGIREVKISLWQRVRERQWNITVFFVTVLYTKRWTTRRFRFVVYNNDNA